MPGELIALGEDAVKIAEALTASNFRILLLLSEERLDVSTIAERLRFSEAYVSGQISLLEELKLVKVSHERGKRGTRKVCQTAIEKVVLVIKANTNET